MALCVPCHNAKTHCDRQGQRWTPPRLRGCDAEGYPLDPSHPWHRGASDHEIDGAGHRAPTSKLN
jgi:hypothetical protein